MLLGVSGRVPGCVMSMWLCMVVSAFVQKGVGVRCRCEYQVQHWSVPCIPIPLVTGLIDGVGVD